MDETRKALWISCFLAMSQVWEWLSPTKERIAVWDGALSDLSVDELRRGVARMLSQQDGTHNPTPGELRKAAIEERVLKNTGQRGAPLGVLDSNREPFVLPEQAGSMVKRLAGGMRPT